ncbi:hypothetical protein SO802_002736 [Lithocarpus litseifolius]|uniref:Protein FAR1-RELATED SEQUENCE n=1 Tax=Lithocarpus litseifolius TaxID=425828 RepID=A0AAW2DY27_9ROSI
MSTAAKSLVEKFGEEGLPIGKVAMMFNVGMNTTQRSEINAFFDSFVNSRTTLKDLVVKFAKVVDSRYKKERKEDFDSRHKTPSLVIGSKIEHQAASIYTRTIFSKFQKELVSSNHFTKEKVEKNGTFYRYKVTSSFDLDDAFIVKLNLESKVYECDCQLFEFMGIVYHTLKKAFGMENELLEDKEDDEMDMHHKSGESANIVEVEDCSVIVPLNIKDPHESQTKDPKKSTEKQGLGGRIKGGLEISLARATTKRRSCQLCGGYGHNRRTCKQYNGEGSDYQYEENMTEVDDNDIDYLA